MTIRVRFAPSPTGALHLGGLRTALYNYLTAKRLGGTFTLRIEDTDRTRLVPGSVENIVRGLEWAGIDYDHGPGRGGPFGPYVQSERLDLYHQYADKLLQSGRAYRCFCKPDTLQATRERLAKMRSNATYDRACTKLTEEEVARRVKAGENYVVRFNDTAVPKSSTPVQDIVFGSLQDGHGSLPTDPILLKTDKFPTYHLASVVDDHEMQITHVIRGEEWLQSLPLHVDLYASLELPAPRFAHLPLLLNPDGSKMSKRKGDVRVSDYIEKGWEPEAVVNWLALAGWGSSRKGNDVAPGQSDGVMTLPELVSKFDIEALTHRRAILDPGKLGNLNKQHLGIKLREVDGGNEVLDRAETILKSRYPTSPHLQRDYISKVVAALLPRVSVLSEIEQPEVSSYLFQEPNLTTPAAQKLRNTVKDEHYSLVLSTLRDLLASPSEGSQAFTPEVIRDRLHTVQTTALASVPTKEIMNALRHALTGGKVGPSVPEILAILGHARSQKRLEIALEASSEAQI